MLKTQICVTRPQCVNYWLLDYVKECLTWTTSNYVSLRIFIRWPRCVRRLQFWGLSNSISYLQPGDAYEQTNKQTNKVLMGVLKYDGNYAVAQVTEVTQHLRFNFCHPMRDWTRITNASRINNPPVTAGTRRTSGISPQTKKRLYSAHSRNHVNKIPENHAYVFRRKKKWMWGGRIFSLFVEVMQPRHSAVIFPSECYVLLIAHLGIVLVNDQLFFYSYMFIPNLYMFRALMCSSSGELIVSIRHLVYVALCKWPSGM